MLDYNQSTNRVSRKQNKQNIKHARLQEYESQLQFAFSPYACVYADLDQHHSYYEHSVCVCVCGICQSRESKYGRILRLFSWAILHGLMGTGAVMLSTYMYMTQTHYSWESETQWVYAYSRFCILLKFWVQLHCIYEYVRNTIVTVENACGIWQ
jgi:hypothetical protein